MLRPYVHAHIYDVIQNGAKKAYAGEQRGSPWAIQLYRPIRQAPYFFDGVFGHRTGLEPGCAPGENRPVATF